MAFSLFMLCYFRGAIFQLEHPPVNYLAGMRLQVNHLLSSLVASTKFSSQLFLFARKPHEVNVAFA
jgi:hypothetical protein